MAKKEKSAKTDDSGSKRTDHGPPIPADKFESQFDSPGIGEDKATAELGTVLEDEPASDLEGYELPDGVDPESLDAGEREALRDRLKESGTIQDAAKALEGVLGDGDAEPADDTGDGEADPDGDADGEPSDTGEGIPWSELAEKAGVDMEAVTVPVKIHGEEFEVSVREAADGYQRRKAFQVKTQELARHRKEAEQTRDEYAQAMEMLLVGLQQNGVGPQQLQGLAAEYQRVTGQVYQQAEAAKVEAVEEGQSKLRESFGWDDEEAWGEARSQLRSYAHDLGYSDDQISNVTDYRLFGALEKARRWDAAQEEAGEIKRTKRRKGRTLKPGTPGGPHRKRPGKARQALRQTGSVDAAAAALLQDGILGEVD